MYHIAYIRVKVYMCVCFMIELIDRCWPHGGLDDGLKTVLPGVLLNTYK